MMSWEGSSACYICAKITALYPVRGGAKVCGNCAHGFKLSPPKPVEVADDEITQPGEQFDLVLP